MIAHILPFLGTFPYDQQAQLNSQCRTLWFHTVRVKLKVS